MEKQSRIKEGVYTVCFMLALTGFCVAGVSAVYHRTRARIEANERADFRRAVLAAAGLDVPVDAREVEEVYRANVEVISQGSDDEKYLLGDNVELVKVSGNGLWGLIRGIAGYDRSRGVLTGVAFLSHSETPGLGARIEEKWFRQQFIGKRAPLTMVAEGTAAGEQQVDAITGATITSEAVLKILNVEFGDKDREH